MLRLLRQGALKNLFERFPNLRLAIPAGELELQHLPMWHRYKSLPVTLRP